MILKPITLKSQLGDKDLQSTRTTGLKASRVVRGTRSSSTATSLSEIDPLADTQATVNHLKEVPQARTAATESLWRTLTTP